MLDKVAICIPTYNNRYSEVLNYINKLTSLCDVFIVFSNSDDKLKEYDSYDWNDKINKVYCDIKILIFYFRYKFFL